MCYFHMVIFWVLCSFNVCFATEIWNEWTPQVAGLKLRIGCEKSVFRVGEEVSIDFEIMNISNNAILLPKQETFGSSQRMLAGKGLFLNLEILHNPAGALYFDNLASMAWLPPTSFVKLFPGQVYKGKIRLDSTASFYIYNEDNHELFGNVDHVGLVIPGGYNVKLVIDINTGNIIKLNWRFYFLNYDFNLAIGINKGHIENQDDAVIWNGKVVSNEITFLIQNNPRQITDPASRQIDLW